MWESREPDGFELSDCTLVDLSIILTKINDALVTLGEISGDHVTILFNAIREQFLDHLRSRLSVGCTGSAFSPVATQSTSHNCRQQSLTLTKGCAVL